MSNDDHCYSKEQYGWRGKPTWGVFEDDVEAQLRRDARFGGEALSRLMGCWDAPPKKPEPKERETKLDTAPQRRGRGRLRPVLTRFGRDVPTTMYWTPFDWENDDGTST